MKALILGAALTAAAVPAQAQSPDDNMAVAAMIEWTIARCGMDGVSPFQVMMAQTIANGSDPAAMTRVREQVAVRVIDHYVDQETACREMKAYLAGG